MVVGTDSVHMKEYSHVHQKLAENFQNSDIIYLPGMFHNLFYRIKIYRIKYNTFIIDATDADVLKYNCIT